VKPDPPPPQIDREVFAKVLSDLRRLPPGAHRLTVEAAVWRAVARHARAMSSDEIAEVTWRILDRLVRRPARAA